MMWVSKIILHKDSALTEELVAEVIACLEGKVPDQAALAILAAWSGIDLLVEVSDRYGRILYVSRDGAWFDGELGTLDAIDGGIPSSGMVELHDYLKHAAHDAVVHYDVSTVLAGDEGYLLRRDGETLCIPYYWVKKGAF